MVSITKVLFACALGVSSLLAFPMLSISPSDGLESGKAFADNRDRGHPSGDIGRQDSRTTSSGN